MSIKNERPIVIVRRRKKAHHAHHGGAWKIAFADFMTAMMALFLVLWILSSSGQAQRNQVAEYFRTPLAVAMAGGDRDSASDSAIPGGGPDPAFAEGERLRVNDQIHNQSSVEQRRLRDLESRIRAAIEADKALRDMKSQIRIDLTLEGLRIQVVDTEQRPMFEIGSAKVAPYMSQLLRTIAPLLNELPNRIQVSGHTDSRPYAGGEAGYSNWELSADRANASRRELVIGGLGAEKLLRISGMSDRLPFEGATPDDPINRRIALIALNESTAQAILGEGIYARKVGIGQTENSSEKEGKPGELGVEAKSAKPADEPVSNSATSPAAKAKAGSDQA